MTSVQTLVQTIVYTLVQTLPSGVQTLHFAPYRGANEVWTRLDGLWMRSGLDCGITRAVKEIENRRVIGGDELIQSIKVNRAPAVAHLGTVPMKRSGIGCGHEVRADWLQGPLLSQGVTREE